MIRIPIHSVTDLITNSSTTIYTYSDRSAEACVKMIDEILKALHVEKTCADMFKVAVGIDDGGYWDLYDWVEDDDDRRPQECPASAAELSELVERLGNAEKPEWLQKLEAAYLASDDINGNRPPNTLHITPLKPEYEQAGELVMEFLYSTNSEAVYT